MRLPTTVPALIAAALALGPVISRAQVPAVAATGSRATGASARTYNGLSEDYVLEQIRTARIVGRHNVGSTSVNFHLRLAADVEAAFKPRSQSHIEDYRAEIAAFRLNRLLGLQRVPPAISRTVSRAQLNLAADTQVLVDRDGSVRGAAIYWVPVLRDSLIDREREITRWSGWLSQRGTVPADQTARAEEISTLLVFDYLIGNWDRWSGQNVAMDAAGHLIYRDNNGGFGEPWVPALDQRVMRWVRRSQRFSRGVIDRARALTEASIRAEMALDPDTSRPMLSNGQIASLLRRRDSLIQYVDGLVRQFGEPNVYPWP